MSQQNRGSGRALTHAELRRAKPDRAEFVTMRRKPITLVLDHVCRNYNLGALFRLCDAFLIERMVIAGTAVDLRKRRLIQAAKGTHRWVPWESVANAAVAVAVAKSAGYRIVAVEQTDTAVSPEDLAPVFPACVVLGSETAGVSQEILDLTDVAVTIPMEGMANSLNVTTAAAIVLYRLSSLLRV